jgi:hypothetical protein
MQGYLAMLNQQRIDASLEEEEGRLSRICGRLSPRVKKIADALEKELEAWQGEGEA